MALRTTRMDVRQTTIYTVPTVVNLTHGRAFLPSKAKLEGWCRGPISNHKKNGGSTKPPFTQCPNVVHWQLEGPSYLQKQKIWKCGVGPLRSTKRMEARQTTIYTVSTVVNWHMEGPSYLQKPIWKVGCRAPIRTTKKNGGSTNHHLHIAHCCKLAAGRALPPSKAKSGNVGDGALRTTKKNGGSTNHHIAHCCKLAAGRAFPPSKANLECWWRAPVRTTKRMEALHTTIYTVPTVVNWQLEGPSYLQSKANLEVWCRAPFDPQKEWRLDKPPFTQCPLL
jgi:hypothetical protein